MGRVFAVVFWATASLSLAEPCPRLLSTSIGLHGPLTVSYDDGALTYWYDGYETKDGQRVASFRRETHRLSLGTLGKVRSVAAQTAPGTTLGYLAVTDSKGMLKVVTPDHKVYAVNVPIETTLSTAAFFRRPARDAQSTYAPMAGLRWADPAGPAVSGRNAYARTQHADQMSPFVLFVAAEKSVYASAWFPHEVVVDDTELRQALAHGIARVRIVPPEVPGGLARRVVEGSSLSLIDPPADRNVSLFIPGTLPGQAIEIRPFERQLTISNPELIDTINFLHVLGPDRLVLASELGQVLVVDSKAKKVLAMPKFPGPVWLTSVSAHRLGDVVHVWAVSAQGKKLYHWASTDLAPSFKEFAPALPEGVSPVAVTTAAQLVPMGLNVAPSSPQGFLTAVVPLRDELALERVLVSGSDGNLYGYVFTGGLLTENPRRDWVTGPFPH